MGKGLKHDKRGAALAALLAGGSLGALVAATAPPAFAQNEAAVEFDIPTQPIAEALVEYARQARVQFVMTVPPPNGLNGNAVRGALRREAALAQLLAGTGYEGEFRGGSFYVRRIDDTPERVRGRRAEEGSGALVQLAQASTRGDARLDVATGGGGEDARAADEEEIVVVGTNIRGVHPDSSPVEIYTAEDIERTGATTTEQFIGKMPQNLATRSQFGAGVTPGAGSNGESVNGIDLRGLGVGTTLVLLNGRRLPLASFGQTADVSLIPASALSRVEVLTDGASAIYGSDAVGGVVNFVLRRDFEGAETSVRYGGANDSDLRQGGVSQLLGLTWDTGQAVATADFLSASALNASDRDFAASVAPGTLTPHDARQSLFGSVQQELGARFTLEVDAGLSARDVKSSSTNRTSTAITSQNNFLYRSETEQAFLNINLDAEIADGLTASIYASYAEIDVDSATRQTRLSNGTSVLLARDTNYAVGDLTAKLDGDLIELPAGAVRFSAGAGLMDEDFVAAVTVSGPVSGRELGRRTSYVFGELFVPLIAPEQNVPFVDRLELSLAARYTNFEDASNPALSREFGDGTSPKVGVLWGITPDFRMRASYGQSFRAPSLMEIDPTSAIFNTQLFPVLNVTVPLVSFSGPASDLAAETSDTYTLGFDYGGARDSGVYLSATYFSIDYQDRIAAGPTSAALANPAAWPDVIYQSSSVDVVEALLRASTPNFNDLGVDLSDLRVAAQTFAAMPGLTILDVRSRNLALSQLDGLDLRAGYRSSESWGQWEVGFTASQMFDYREQTTPSAPVNTVVDTVARPVDLRARGFANVSAGRFNGTLSVNYVDDYSNPFAVGGAQEVESWTTADLSVAYAFGAPTHGLRVTLSIQNLTDEMPPFVGLGAGGILRTRVGFDPMNANPLGRLIVLGVTKRW